MSGEAGSRAIIVLQHPSTVSLTSGGTFGTTPLRSGSLPNDCRSVAKVHCQNMVDHGIRLRQKSLAPIMAAGASPNAIRIEKTCSSIRALALKCVNS